MSLFYSRFLNYQRDNDKKTALHLALEYRLQSHAKALLDFESNWIAIVAQLSLFQSAFIDGSIVRPDLETKNGKDALQMAIEKGFHLDLISNILER